MAKYPKIYSLEQARAYVETLPIQALIEGFSELLWESQNSKVEPIKVTREQLEAHFKIIGLNASGEVETRGRKRKEV